MNPTEAIAIVRFNERGEITYHIASDARFRLFIVDERAPHDRVYEWLPRASAEEVGAILGSDPIGSSQDERHAAIAAKIEASQEGRPHLSVVSAEAAQED